MPRAPLASDIVPSMRNRPIFRNRSEIGNMTEPSAGRTSTQVSRIIKAPRKTVYRACLDPDSVASWRAPDNMKAHVHVFDARQGGRFRVSLTYQDVDHSPGGKTSE